MASERGGRLGDENVVTLGRLTAGFGWCVYVLCVNGKE